MKLYVFIAVCFVQFHSHLAENLKISRTINENSGERKELATPNLETDTEIQNRSGKDEDEHKEKDENEFEYYEEEDDIPLKIIQTIPKDSRERDELSMVHKPLTVEIDVRIDIPKNETYNYEPTEEEKRLEEEKIALDYFPSFKRKLNKILLDYWILLDTKKSMINAYKYFEENYDDLMSPYRVNANTLAMYAKILILYARKVYSKVDDEYKELCEKALNNSFHAMDMYDGNGQAHLWYAVSLYLLIEINSPPMPIELAKNDTEAHFHIASAELFVIDPYLYHFRGQWKLFSGQPMDSACFDFYRADDLKLDWEDNIFYEKLCKPRELLNDSLIPVESNLMKGMFKYTADNVKGVYERILDFEEQFYYEVLRSIDMLVHFESNETIQAALDILEENYDERKYNSFKKDLQQRFSMLYFLKAHHLYNDPNNKEYKKLCLKAKDLAAKILEGGNFDENANLWYVVTLQAVSEFDQSVELKLELQSIEDHFDAASNIGETNAYYQFSKGKWLFQKLPLQEWRFPACFHIKKAYDLKPKLIESTTYFEECKAYIFRGSML